MKRSPLNRGTKQMKRSGFKRPKFEDIANSINKPKTPLKRKIEGNKKASKPKLKTLKQLKEILWELCRQITFKRYGNVCYTSGQQNLEGKNLQCGHGKPKGALKLKYQYDLRNLRPQSFNANINLGGMSDIFISKLEREKEGLEFLNEACVKIDGRWEIKHEEPMTSMQSYFFLIEKIEEYKKLL